MAQRFLECRRVILKTSRGVLDSREAARRTLTAKLLNSNPLIDRNNRFGLLLELVKNLIKSFSILFYPAFNVDRGRCDLDCTNGRFVISLLD